MAKIKDTSVYPTVTPSSNDLIIATDVSDENKTVTFLVSSLTGAGGAAQGLQSVLDTGNVATQNITLTGNINVTGTVYPTTITAGGSTGTAGQLLSSTGTGIQWVNSPAISCCPLQSTLTAGNTTSLDISTTGSIQMSGAGQSLALSGGSDITLASGSTITTADSINLGTTLNFGATTTINDYSDSTGAVGSVLTVNAAGTGIQWSAGVPSASMPTIQQVLTKGNTATAIGISFVGASSTTFDATSTITSAADNTWSGTNTFSATGSTDTTAGIALTGTLYDGASIGTAGQVLTSTGSGVSWASTAGVSSVSAQTATNSTGVPLTITPTSGAVLVTPHIYNGGSNVGAVPSGGTSTSYLRGDGNWASIPASEFSQTYVFNSAGSQMDQNTYFTYRGIDDSNFNTGKDTVDNNLGASSPTAGTYSAIDYFAGIITSNAQVGSCGSSLSNHIVCSVDYSLISSIEGTFELSLWKVSTSAVAAGALVAQCSIVPGINTIGSCSATLTALNTTLGPGNSLLFTIRQTAVAGAYTPTLQGRIDIKFTQS